MDVSRRDLGEGMGWRVEREGRGRMNALPGSRLPPHPQTGLRYSGC
jgi:hypothetical protein